MLQKLGRIFEFVARRATLLGAYAAGVGVLYMTIFITWDVAMRFFLNMPTIWVDELSNYTLVLMTFLGLSWALSERAHIRIDIVVSRLPRGIANWQKVIASVAFLLFTCLLFLWTWQYFWETVQFGSTTRTIWNPPLAPWQSAIPIGFFILILLLLVNIYYEVRIARGKEKAVEEESVKDIM